MHPVEIKLAMYLWSFADIPVSTLFLVGHHLGFKTKDLYTKIYGESLKKVNSFFTLVFQIRIRIWIHRIHMFLGLPDLDPDPSIILSSSSKNIRKNLDSYYFLTSFGLFIFEK
jgi:hypothetical protein